MAEITEIPATYWRVIPEQREVDKKAILEAFKEDGEIVAGCDIIRDRTRLEVR